MVEPNEDVSSPKSMPKHNNIRDSLLLNTMKNSYNLNHNKWANIETQLKQLRLNGNVWSAGTPLIETENSKNQPSLSERTGDAYYKAIKRIRSIDLERLKRTASLDIVTYREISFTPLEPEQIQTAQLLPGSTLSKESVLYYRSLQDGQKSFT